MTHRSVLVMFFTALALSVVVVLHGAQTRLPGNNVGYAPEQPIAFSHALHAGELDIDCLYCHSGAETSRHAGIPETGVCMNCHKYVSAPMLDIKAEEAAATEQGRDVRPVVSPEIAKIRQAMGLADDGSPDPNRPATGIEWVQVNRLADFVYFDHSRHVGAGVDCKNCHGDVRNMNRIRQTESLSMGWCIDCHREVNDKGWQERTDLHASTDCAVCHY